jgi:hypothetical protein
VAVYCTVLLFCYCVQLSNHTLLLIPIASSDQRVTGKWRGRLAGMAGVAEEVGGGLAGEAGGGEDAPILLSRRLSSA